MTCRSHLPHKTLSADALDLLARQPWPGNIRELRNALEQATLMTDERLLTAGHFTGLGAVPVVPVVRAVPATSRAANLPAASAAAGDRGIKPLPQAVAELAARAIRDALVATGGNKLAASRLLGLSRATLYENCP